MTRHRSIEPNPRTPLRLTAWATTVVGACGLIGGVASAGNDTGGYAAGVFFGKHPMAPAISPKKSWEGFVGSLIAQALIGAFIVPALLPVAAWQGVVLGLVMAVTATIGDFAESAIKRDLGVKDMSHALPGHGGFMDRLDSLLINAVISWIAFRIMGV